MPGEGEGSPATLAEFLGKTPLFSTLTGRHLRSLTKAAKVVSFPASSPIVRQGDPGDSLYLLLRGGAEVRRGDRTLSRIGPGQFFGEMTLLDAQPRSADVIAVVPSECAVLSQREFWAFAKDEPDVLQAMGREMARRLREADRSLSE